MIGTTHFTNAVVQRRDLGRVAAVRIGLPSGASSRLRDWPEDLADLVARRGRDAGSGTSSTAARFVPFDGHALREAARRIRAAGIRSARSAAVFSPLNASGEEGPPHRP